MMMRTTMLTGLVVLTAGCGVFGPSREDRLADARALWAAEGPPSYRITVRRLCFCISALPVRVTVQEGVVVMREFVDSEEPFPPELGPLYPAVPGLFDLVEDAFARADRIEVQFDPSFGFPTSIDIDYEKHAIDDELAVLATDFVALTDQP